MATPKIFESEYRFCLILWEREPVSSAELAKICKEKLGWSRTTTYTVIHRLGERGIVKNENGLVSSLVSKDEAQAAELDELVEKYDCLSLRRGKGLMQGVVVAGHPVGEIVKKALEQGLIVLSAGSDVLRFVPPLVITKEDIDEMAVRLTRALEA